MPRGDKRHYTNKQEREAEHIAAGYKKRGVSAKESKRRAWATVNKIHKGGELKGGSGYGKKEDRSPSRKGGRIGARSRTKASRVQAGKKAAATRKRKTARRATAAKTRRRR